MEASAAAFSPHDTAADFSPESFFLVQVDGTADPFYQIGLIRSSSALGPEGSDLVVPVILITAIQGKILAAIPHSFWHRQVAKRQLPPQSFTKASGVSVSAVLQADRETIVENQSIKVWIGFLAEDTVSCLDFLSVSPDDLTAAFLTENGEDLYVPAAEALQAVADEKFGFLTAESGDGQTVGHPDNHGQRISKVEETLVEIKAALQQLTQPRSASLLSQPKVKIKPKAVVIPPSRPNEPIAGLDSHVVSSALKAGVSRNQLEELGRMLHGKKPDLQDVARPSALRKPPKLDILGESEEEQDDADFQGIPAGLTPEEAANPVHASLEKLSLILENLTSPSKKSKGLQDTLDDSVGHAEVSSSSSGSTHNRRHAAVLQTLRKAVKDCPEEVYAVLEKNMLQDCGAPELGPGLGILTSSFRGWAEHRSRVPNIQGTVRTLWAICGALDSLRNNRVEEAKARLALLIGHRSSVLRQRFVVAGSRSVVGRRSALCELHQACSSRDFRGPSQPLASCTLGRSHDVQNPRTGRFRREKSQVGSTSEPEPARPISSSFSAKSQAESERERKTEGGSRRSCRFLGYELKDPESSKLEPDPACNPLHESRDQDTRRVPGKKASTVSPIQWLNSSFRFLQKSQCSFAKFLQSFLRKSASPPSPGGTAKLWPMPLPFPGALLETKQEPKTRALQRGLNLCVAALNWLHLNRPLVCPLEIVVPALLNGLQWKVVRCMEVAFLAWIDCEPVDAAAMGRSAAKVEDIEKALKVLGIFETEVIAGLDSTADKSSGARTKPSSIFRMSPGLQKTSPGDVVGILPGDAIQLAQPIEADRLDFRGVPAFDPAPYLDDLGRRIFKSPIQAAADPSEVFDPPPRVRIFSSEQQKWALFRKLDSTERLGVVRRCEILEGYQAGLFSIPKDADKDRLIFDSRPFNTLEHPPNRWIASMAAASNLLDLQIAPGQQMVVSGTDLREFYYSFLASEERVRRNALLGEVFAHQIRDFKCYHPDLEGAGPLIFGLKTLAMGDSCAVELAQTAHLGVLVQLGLVSEGTLMAMNLPPPRSLSMLGVVIDDLILFETLAASSSIDKDSCKTGFALDEALSNYERLGLIPHPGKTFKLESSGEFWGSLFDGKRGLVRANLKRVIPLVFATVGVLKLGVCTISLLNVLVGSWTSVFLYKRRLLSLINLCYSALHADDDPRSVLRLSDELRAELCLMVALAPLAVTRISAENSEWLYASDASSWGLAVCRTKIPTWLQGEIHRHKLQKNTWVKLLSPAKALDRTLGRLGEDEELPSGDVLAGHPLHSLLISSLQFEEVCREKSRDGLHINIGELRGMIKSEKLSALAHFPNRSMYLADSQVALGTWVKGRSSSFGLNNELQRSLPIHLGCALISNGGYVFTEINVADDPTRGKSVRVPSNTPPPWILDDVGLSVQERLKFLDEFLKLKGADPWTLSGLPSFDELRSSVEAMPSFSARQQHSKQHFSATKVESKPKSFQSGVKHPEAPQSSKAAFRFPAGKLSQSFQVDDEAQLLLGTFDRSQFLFPSSWNVPQLWKPGDSWPNEKGYLDLYSGKKGVASAVCEIGSTWGLTFEIEEGDSQDLSDRTLREKLHRLVALGVFFAVGAAIFCRSFSRAVRPPIRSRQFPRGLLHLTERMQKAVFEGNNHADWLAEFLKFVISCGLQFWVENPDGSFLWALEAWIELGSQLGSKLFRLDYCRCGCPWRKRTRFLTSCHLAGQRLFCTRDHKHRCLVGWSKIHKASWTHVAQVYPKILCSWVASAILIDAGIVTNRRRINLAEISGQSGRIGEASNPGPRLPRKRDRRIQLLDSATLVEPGTELIGTKIWERFRRWALHSLTLSTFEQLILCPQTLVEMLEAFGRHLFASGDSIYLYRHLLTAVQRWQPDFRPFLGRAWQLILKWESLEPTVHRTPLPLVLFRAMVSVAAVWGWHRFLGIMLISFFGICRPGEPLSATRADLLLPRDLVYEQPDVCFLCIRKPKSRRRGIGVVQHSKILSAEVVAALDEVFSGLQPEEPLFSGTATTFRRRWDAILLALGVPKRLAITPASMRSGGAITAYRADEDIVKILWRMRLKSLQTFSYYLQEVGALSIFAELPGDCRIRIEKAAELYSSVLPSPSFSGGA